MKQRKGTAGARGAGSPRKSVRGGLSAETGAEKAAGLRNEDDMGKGQKDSGR